jgi:hypothetical protein
MDGSPSPHLRETEHFELARGRVRIYSERWPLKYLISNHGICLGVDTKRRSFLFLAHRGGLLFRERPVGDTVVEDLDYEIPAIIRALRMSDPGSTEGRARSVPIHRPRR